MTHCPPICPYLFHDDFRFWACDMEGVKQPIESLNSSEETYELVFRQIYNRTIQLIEGIEIER